MKEGKLRDIEMKYFSCEIKVDAEKSTPEMGVFDAFASVFGNIDKVDDIMEIGAFTKTLNDNGGDRPLYWLHRIEDNDSLIGKAACRQSDKGLPFTGYIPLKYSEGSPNKTALNTFDKMRDSIINCCSIGYKTVKSWTQELEEPGRDWPRMIRHLTEVALREVSVLPKGFAANELALITNVKSIDDIYGYLKANIDDKELMYKILSLYGIKEPGQSTLVEPVKASTPKAVDVDMMKYLTGIKVELQEMILKGGINHG